jgi:hypothetical protein
MSVVRRGIVGVVPVLCVLVGCALLYGAPAFATEVHVYKATFGSPGSGPGELDRPLGIAVNSSTDAMTEPAAGDVYVVDSANDRVERFSSTGVYLGQFDGGGTYEVVEGGVAKVETEPLEPPVPLSEPLEIAVDNSGDPVTDPSAGDVYVVDKGHDVIDKFSAVGVYLGQLTGAGTPGGPFSKGGVVTGRSIEGVAVDPDGVVWVTTHEGSIYNFSNGLENHYSGERTTKFGGIELGLGVDSEDNLYLNTGRRFAKVNSSGEILLNPFGGDEDPFAVAVDAKGGEVYLDNLESVEAFSLEGAPIEGSGVGAPFPSFGAGDMSESVGVAVDEGDGDVYVTNRSADTVSMFEGVPLPTANVGVVSGQEPRSVTLNGTVDPDGEPVTSCEFEYATAEEYEAGKTYGYKETCEPDSLGVGEEQVNVKAEIKGLTPGVTYHYRLVAENAAHFPSTTADQEFVVGPILGDEFVSDVASSSATLQASLDPNGGETSYYFEYGTGAGYGSFAPVPAPGVDAGSALESQAVKVHVQGLSAGTEYHYRFVAVQGGEVLVQPDRTFVTQGVGGSSPLVDGRAWELVTPVDKHGALIEPSEYGGQVQAASNGSGVAYFAEGGSPGESPAGKLKYAQVLSRRGSAGWSTEDLTLPGSLPENGEPAGNLFGVEPEYHLFSPDLSRAVVEPQEIGTSLLSGEAKTRTLYLRSDSDGVFSPLVTPGNVPPGTTIEESDFSGTNAAVWEMVFLAATPDLEHVVFKTPMALTPEAPDEENVKEAVEKHQESERVQSNLYEWSDGRLQLVNILPETDENEIAHAPDEVAHGRSPVPVVKLADLTENTGKPRGGVQRDVSSDGRRIAWMWGEPFNPQGLASYRGLYVRDMVEERTVRIGGRSAIYQTMNAEGSKIFYLENGDLYVYDFEAGTTTDLTADHGGGEPDGGVQELVSDVSENGSYVYFVATGVLAEGGVSRANNLYVSHNTGSGWTTTHIATLSSDDRPTWYAATFWVPFSARISSRVSPNGQFLVFMSDRSLTGYDNTDAVSGEPDEEVYEYDAPAEKLVCASCDPTGARPVGILDKHLLVDPEGLWTAKGNVGPPQDVNHWLAGSVPGWDGLANQPATYQPRYLSNSGRMFFDSPVGLVPQDTNGLEDVYEYEPEGVGGCTSSASSAMFVYVKEIDGSPEDGCVGLISSGTSSEESAFYDASENGDDVFFDTTSKLVPEDADKAYDLYDAHVCGAEGVACHTAPVSPPACVTIEACRVAPSPQPEFFGAPPSATFDGAGNVTSVPVVAPVVKRSLTRAQRLADALKACGKVKSKKRHATCEKRARRRYGPVKAAKRSSDNSSDNRRVQ